MSNQKKKIEEPLSFKQLKKATGISYQRSDGCSSYNTKKYTLHNFYKPISNI